MTMKQDTAHQALLDSCSESMQGWAVQHLGTLYKMITVPIMDLLSSFGNAAHAVVPQAYGLCLSVWSDEDEAAHKKALVPDLIDETTLAFIYEEILSLNNNNSETVQYPFEHIGVADTALDAVWVAGYGQHVNSVEAISNILATSGAAIFCRLQEHSDSIQRSINFSAAAFKQIYNKLLLLIMGTIKTTLHLLERWNKYTD
ncbi:hypothetical protein BDR03DRAFT_1018098 [Suillus americanus]|nr:hypothetical protein BDR03DRAFT_1018098 [Suillus americanus]